MGSVFVLERNSPLGCNWREREGEKESEVEEGGRDRRNCLAGAVWDDSVFDR